MSSREFSPPDEFDDYKILRPLGKGGMGHVYLGLEFWLNRPVAIKFINLELPTAQDRQRFRIEAVALARIQHPNVMAVYRAGQVAGRPYIAGEWVDGQPLDSVAKPMDWRRALDVAIGLARGLAAIHQHEILHRDIKPSNAILTEGGQVKLVDFGIAKLVGGDALLANVPGAAAGSASEEPDRERRRQLDDGMETRSMEGEAPAAAHDVRQQVLSGLTLPGSQLGTPSYMAPEVWNGKGATAQSDVYSLGVLMYELCSGRRPFEAETPLALGHRVTHADPTPLPQVAPTVDARLVKVIECCLRRDPKERYPSAVELCADLEALAARLILGRRIARNVAFAALLIIALSVAGNRLSRWLETRHAVAAHLRDAQAALAEGRTRDAQVEAQRRQAFLTFDSQQKDEGERLWTQVRESAKASYDSYQHATREFDTALLIAPGRADIRRQLALALFEKATMLDRDHRDEQLDEVRARLESLFSAAEYESLWNKPGQLSLATQPAPASVELLRYVPDAQGKLAVNNLGPRGSTPLTLSLPPGSYLLILKAPGRETVRLPILIHRGEQVEAPVYLPALAEIPSGYVYIPPGQFLFGTVWNDQMRRVVFGTVPAHPIHTVPFLIAQRETTINDWLAFLKTLSPEAREQYRPHSSEGASQGGHFDVQPTADGSWQLTLAPVDGQNHTARLGERIIYEGRTVRRSIDWSKLPVVGIAYSDALAYTEWLRRSGAVPGARLCTEREWERAARGADSREYPHGNWLDPDDANIDITYDRNVQAFGPDEVGSHPASQSPFGVDDLAGNVWEWVTLTRTGKDKDGLAKGGAYYFDKLTAQISNREVIHLEHRTHRLGLRVCADFPLHQP